MNDEEGKEDDKEEKGEAGREDNGFRKSDFFAMRMIAGQLHHYDYDKRTSIAGGGGLMV